MRVRRARPDDLPAVMNVLDGAMLAADADRVRGAIREGTVFVAAEGDRLLGALVLDGDRVEAVAVRRARRGQGIGTALVERAAAARARLTAEFDPAVRPFYERLGFAVERRGGRLFGRRE